MLCWCALLSYPLLCFALVSAALTLAINKEKAFQFIRSLVALVRRPARMTVHKDVVARLINVFD
jgi:hypothetical protein